MHKQKNKWTYLLATKPAEQLERKEKKKIRHVTRRIFEMIITTEKLLNAFRLSIVIATQGSRHHSTRRDLVTPQFVQLFG